MGHAAARCICRSRQNALNRSSRDVRTEPRPGGSSRIRGAGRSDRSPRWCRANRRSCSVYWTLKSRGTAGGEPDECYIVGADQSKDRPDLVIEVIWTSGGIDQLAIYHRLGIDEVSFWIAGRLEIHSLRNAAYERIARSRWLPGLDLDLMCTFFDRRSVHMAKRDSREALRNEK